MLKTLYGAVGQRPGPARPAPSRLSTKLASGRGSLTETSQQSPRGRGWPAGLPEDTEVGQSTSPEPTRGLQQAIKQSRPGPEDLKKTDIET